MDASAFTAILDVSAPVLLLIAVGTFLRKRRIIDDSFISSGSRFVFMVGMPTLLFFSMLGASPGDVMSWQLPVYFFVGIMVTFGFAWWASGRIHLPENERGHFIQMAFRGNTGVFSLALVVNMFGDEGVVIGGVLASITSVTFNVLAETAFARFQDDRKLDIKVLLKTIATNPMIVGVAAGILVNLIGLPVPSQVVSAGKYLGGVTLPLALLCIGGSLATSRFSMSKQTTFAMGIKVFISPIVLTIGASLLGFSQHEQLYLFLFFGAPIAASAYVVSVAHGSNGKETANAIATSTLIGSAVLVLIGPPLLSIL
ncbi:AEC family transporter [Rhodanobacter aciditrophus]|uniref:AEC family transporter n=1 Tax=Rhodanobacter aciditrophus TaxID=1623218 RepID=A0ABW4B0N5_9GAMM